MNITSYGYVDLAIPLDNLGADKVELLDAGGNTATHKDILSVNKVGQLIYIPMYSIVNGYVHGYFSKDDNIILKNVSWKIRGPEYAKSWIKMVNIYGQKCLKNGTIIEYMPILGAKGTYGAPHYRESMYFPESMNLDYFFNSHPAGQNLNMKFQTAIDLDLKITDTDLMDFYRDTAAATFKAHHLYFSVIYQFFHTIALSET